MSQHDTDLLSVSGSISVSHSDVFYLTKVSYNEAKHEMLVEFSNSKSRIVERHRFFPFTLFSNIIEKDKLQDLLLSAGFKGFSLEDENNLICLKALSFSDLKKISNSLVVFINKKPLVLEPERAFLISKNWSYLDSFEKQSNKLYKVSPLEKATVESFVHSLDLGFFLTKEIPFSEALRVNESDALFLVDLAAWSNILSLPIDKVPKEVHEKAEVFLENIFFKHGELLSFNSQEKIYTKSGFEPLGFGDPLSKIDFSPVWASLFSNNFFNIGPETRNCSCCVPVVLEANNLLPSSLIKVRFLDDNIFYESFSESFSFDFHNSNPAKDARVSKKKEFFLSSFPIGPFFKNDSALVPLMDAKRLIDEKKAVLVSSKDVSQELGFLEIAQISKNTNPIHELNWFCKNKESFFSKEVRSSNSILFALRKVLDKFENNLFLDYNFSNLFFSAVYRSLSFSLCELPNQLTNPNSKFFSTELAKSIVSVQESTISKFKEFSEKEGYRVLHANKNSAFVKGFSSLKLAKDFSSKTSLPQPQIVGFSRKALGGFA
ncbi:MAG: hypothetical protein WCI04_01580 [archaeon]